MKTKLNEDTVNECLQYMRQMQQKDRLMFDKANRAFVSYVQAYRKHECNLILQLKDIDLGKLAMGFGLLRMPKMPELKGKNMSSFVGPEIDVNTIPYVHKQRELHRIKRLREYQDSGTNNFRCKQKRTESWSETKKKKLERQEKRNKRREKKELKQQFSTVSNKKKRKRINEEDIEQLAKDIALIKRFKKRKVMFVDFLLYYVCSENKFSPALALALALFHVFPPFSPSLSKLLYFYCVIFLFNCRYRRKNLILLLKAETVGHNFTMFKISKFLIF